MRCARLESLTGSGFMKSFVLGKTLAIQLLNELNLKIIIGSRVDIKKESVMKKIMAIVALFSMGLMQARYPWGPMDIDQKESAVLDQEKLDVKPEGIEKKTDTCNPWDFHCD